MATVRGPLFFESRLVANIVDIGRNRAYIVGMAGGTLGEFEVVILLAVLRTGPGAYGSGIRDEIERRAGEAPARGAVYVTLDRLERKGYLRSSVGDAADDRGGRPRRYYRVSARGMAMLRKSLAVVTRMREGLESVLEPS